MQSTCSSTLYVCFDWASDTFFNSLYQLSHCRVRLKCSICYRKLRFLYQRHNNCVSQDICSAQKWSFLVVLLLYFSLDAALFFTRFSSLESKKDELFVYGVDLASGKTIFGNPTPIFQNSKRVYPSIVGK